MLVFQEQFYSQNLYSFSYEKEDMVFFDIETTGLLYDISSLYLIGCSYYKQGSWHIKQWFADDYRSELTILHEFFQFIQNYSVLIHYNGNRFDIPYLTKKCAQLHLDYTFSNIQSIDIYKLLLPHKKLFHLPNLKQTTIESFLPIVRKDTYNGKELVDLYSRYITGKWLGSEESKKLLPLLLLHNKEDIIGLMELSVMLAYCDLFEKKPIITNMKTENECFIIDFTLFSYLPAPITLTNAGFLLSAKKNQGQLTIPVYRGELKYFYKNFKDYYYLPEEDTAIHKSVGLYVDKEHRQKATSSNCYTRKSGKFIMQYGKTLTPFFQKDCKNKNTYIELTETLKNHPLELSIYTKGILDFLQKTS